MVRRSQSSVDFDAWCRAQGGYRAAGRVLGTSHTTVERWAKGKSTPRGDGELGPAWIEARTGVSANAWHILSQAVEEAPAAVPPPRRAPASPPAPEPAPAPPRPAEPGSPSAMLDVPADDPRWRTALANLIAQGGFRGRETVEKIRASSGLSSEEVAAIVADAAALCAADRGSTDVTLETSVAFYTLIRQRATDANDWKTAIIAQGAIDKLLLNPKARPAPPPPPAAMVPAAPPPPPSELQASALLGAIVTELANWPEARAAVLSKLKAAKQALRDAR